MIKKIVLIITILLLFFCINIDAVINFRSIARSTRKVARFFKDSIISGSKCSYPPAELATDINKVLKEKVCGQVMAIDMFTRQLENRNHETKEPLLLFWQGDTGVGKTLASNFLKDYMSLYVLGDSTGVPVSKQSVEDILDICTYPIILIEDIDRESHNIIKILDYFVVTERGKRDAKNVIFIFTMNLGGGEVMNYIDSSPEIFNAFKHNRFQKVQLIHERILRSRLKKHLTKLANRDATTATGASFHSLSILRDYISEYIPWLPITSSEVDCCINQHLFQSMQKSANINPERLRDLSKLDIRSIRIADPYDFTSKLQSALTLTFDLVYPPARSISDSLSDPANAIMLSVSGCRSVDRNVENVFLEAFSRFKRRLSRAQLGQPLHLIFSFREFPDSGVSSSTYADLTGEAGVLPSQLVITIDHNFINRDEI